jgi:histidyl-tRNA synthetase
MIIVEEAAIQALLIAEQLRNQHTNWKITVDTIGGNFKNQFKRADKSGADLALILGLDELRNKQISVKNLRELEEQRNLNLEALESYLNSKQAELNN